MASKSTIALMVIGAFKKAYFYELDNKTKSLNSDNTYFKQYSQDLKYPEKSCWTKIDVVRDTLYSFILAEILLQYITCLFCNTYTISSCMRTDAINAVFSSPVLCKFIMS